MGGGEAPRALVQGPQRIRARFVASCKSRSLPCAPYARDKPQPELQHARAQLSPAGLPVDGQTDRQATKICSGASAGLCWRKTTSHAHDPGEFCEVPPGIWRHTALSWGMPGELEGNHVPLLWCRQQGGSWGPVGPGGDTKGRAGGCKVSAGDRPWVFAPWGIPAFVLEAFAPRIIPACVLACLHHG